MTANANTIQNKTAGASSRRAAAELLLRIRRDGGYSNIVLDSYLNRLKDEYANPSDMALITRLVYGVTERRITLDYVIARHCSQKLNRLHPAVLELLRIGVYQLLYMDRIPPSAAVNETVKAARNMKQDRASGMINAVLRAVDRNRESLFADLTGDHEGISVRASCPAELLQFWTNAYGLDTAVRLAESCLEPPPFTVCVNTRMISPDQFEALLNESGIGFERNGFLPACFTVTQLTQPNSLKNLANLPENCYYHQDAASQLCCRALLAAPGMRIADVCAAPGGKTLGVSAYMNGEGYFLASDSHPGKCGIMKKRFSDMELPDFEVLCRDASEPWPESLHGTFDRVVCDAPCSGLGVIRRKPEIKYKRIKDFEDLPEIQMSILESASALVRPGGFLQYSTCTLNPSENEMIADGFLDRHPDFSPRILPLDECFSAAGQAPAYHITLMPHIHGTDGFFIAGFLRNRQK